MENKEENIEEMSLIEMAEKIKILANEIINMENKNDKI